MSLLDILFGKKKATASVAKERLQIILAHERASLTGDGKNQVDQDALTVNLENRDNLELLEINVTLPEKE